MVISNFYPIIGGAERQALSLSKALLRQGVQVSILTRFWRGLKKFELIDGVPVYRVGISNRSKFGSVISALAWVVFLLKHRKQFDVFHAHQPHSSALVCGIIGGLLKKARVAKIPGGRGLEYLKRAHLRRSILKLIIKRFIVVNEQAQNELQNLGIDNNQMVLIPNAVDTSYFCLPSSKKIPPTPLPKGELGGIPEYIAVYTGRLEYVKGVDILLKAWKRVIQERQNASLMIVGKGSMEEQLRAMANELGLSELVKTNAKPDSIIFTGPVDDVKSYLQKADIFVLPSRTEGISNSLLEAMASGLPVVATAVAGNKQVVEHEKNGLLVPPENDVRLAKAISRIMQNRTFAEILGKKARETIESRFSIEAIAKDYLSLYSSLLSR